MAELSASLSSKLDKFTDRKERISTVEFWRFAFTLLVCWYHLEFSAGMGQTVFTSGSSAVEFFFVLAGFTLAMSAFRKYEKRMTPMTTKEACAEAVDFVKKKLKAFYPILIVVMLVWLVFILQKPSAAAYNPYASYGFGGFGATNPAAAQSVFEFKLDKLMNSEWEFLFLVGTPFGINNYNAPNIPMWFLSALLVIGYLYTFFINKFPSGVRMFAPVLGVLGYSFYALSVTQSSYFFTPLEFASLQGFLPAGMVKAIAEMSLGVSAYLIYEYISKKDLKMLVRVLLSLLEIYAIYRFFKLTIKTPVGYDNVRRLIYIMMIVMFSFLNATFFAKLFNRKFWRHLGHLSFAMYLSHYFLVRPYVNIISWFKSSAEAGGGLANFLRGMGGGTSSLGGRASNPMGLKDMVAFAAFVMAASALMLLVIKLFSRFVYQPASILYRSGLPPEPKEQDVQAI